MFFGLSGERPCWQLSASFLRSGQRLPNVRALCALKCPDKDASPLTGRFARTCVLSAGSELKITDAARVPLPAPDRMAQDRRFTGWPGRMTR
ncbi:hypothetical protein GGR01_001491 [Acetobacter oeni]|nr:hypothetical protein [Acetobacter oeni]